MIKANREDKMPIKLVFFYVIYVSSVYSYRLNVPRILLPIFDDLSSNFTLEVTEGGCYEWKLSSSSKIQLTHLDLDPSLGCSTKVTVSAVTKDKSRDIAVVLAEDVTSKRTLRCDVILDVIHHLEIVTTTKELFMGETPEVFEVRAYDDQGNEFSTLEGVEFDWNIYCTGSSQDSIVLRFITFEESPYETPLSVQELEKNGKQGHMILLDSFKTGAAKVTVSLPYKEYKHIETCQVQLSVVANLIINPSDAYIMIGDTITFKVCQLTDGKMDEITLPNSQYYFKLEDSSSGSLQDTGGKVKGLAVGKTRIVLYDKNVNEDALDIKLPAATLNVVNPSYMSLVILPHRNWAVLESDYCEIVAEVYAETGNRIHLGPESRVAIEINERSFQVQERSKNGSWINGRAQQVGVSKLSSSLRGFRHVESAFAELHIFPLFAVVPAENYLPWDPILKPRHNVQLEVVGSEAAAAAFSWTSNNESIGLVNRNGKVTTIWHGHFRVFAEMNVNHRNRRSSSFHIVPATRLEIIEYYPEGEIDSNIFVYVTLYTDVTNDAGIPFTKCDDLPFEVKVSNPNFAYNKSATAVPIGSACAAIGIVASSEGSSRVTITYRTGDDLVLEDSTTVNAFKPLRLIYPDSNEIALAVGTCFSLMFSGGPQPHLSRNSVYKRSIEVESEASSGVTVQDVTDSYKAVEADETILHVFCRKLGQVRVNLTIVNDLTAPSNFKKEASAVAFEVICAKPREISLEPGFKPDKKCPMDFDAENVLAHSFQDMELSVIVLDERRRRFLNVTSLKFDWFVSPANLADVESKSSTLLRNFTERGFVYSEGNYQIVKVEAGDGATIEVQAKIVGYHKHILRQAKVTAEWPEFMSETDRDLPAAAVPTIATKIKLHVIADAVVVPNSITMYNHPNNKNLLTVDRGSGHYLVKSSSENIAHVEYVANKHHLELVPLRNGESHIKLIDLCLASPPTLVRVNVVSIDHILVEMIDKVQVDKGIACILKVYDENDQLLRLPNLEMIDIVIDTESNIIEFERTIAQEDDEFYQLYYVISGRKIGNTKIIFSIDDVDSDPMDLQVFPPLKVYPKNATMLIGGTLQLNAKGGPQPDNTIEYFVKDDIIDVDSSGLIHALSVGHAIIQVKSVGIHPITGAKIIFSEDSIDLHVSSMSDLKIFTPLRKFMIGATIPVWVIGIPENLSPVVIGTLEPPLKFEWTVESHDIIELEPVFTLPGIRQGPENSVAMKVTGLSVGKSSVYVKISIPDTSISYPFRMRDTLILNLDVEVFEKLRLISPLATTANSILIPPHSSAALVTNVQVGSERLQYGLLYDGFSSNKSTNHQNNRASDSLIRISRNGIVTSFGKTGTSLVFITLQDEYGSTQTIFITVEIRHLHYMLLSTTAAWITKTQIVGVPVGAEFKIKATFHDESGLKFAKGSFDLKYYSSRSDLIAVQSGNEESSLIVAARRPGSAVLKVWAGETSTCFNYIKFTVGLPLSPQINYLTTGDIVCFWSPLSASETISIWNSSNYNVLYIDNSSGIAQVIDDANDPVYVRHSLHPAHPLQVNIEPANEILLKPDQNKILTNAPQLLPYHLPLLIKSHKTGHKTGNLITGWDCEKQLLSSLAVNYPFTCFLQFSNRSVEDISKVLRVEASFDPFKGSFTCKLFSTSHLNKVNSRLLSSVKVWAELSKSNGVVVSNVVEVPFVPGIFVEEEISADSTFTAYLTVYGIESVVNNVEVEPADKTLLRVNKVTNKGADTIVYNIRILDYHWKLNELGDALTLIVTSRMTGQTVTVRVVVPDSLRLKNMQCATAAGPFRSPLLTFLLYNYQAIGFLISTALLLVALYVFLCSNRPAINVNLSPNRRIFNGNSPTNISTRQVRTLSYFNTRSNSPSNRSAFSPHSSSIANSPFISREPVYGDDTTYYPGNEDLHRNKTFL